MPPQSTTSPSLLDHFRKPPRAVLVALIMGLLVLLFILVGQFQVYAPIDFSHYKTATLMLLGGKDPYQVVEFFFPPWFAVLFAPFALFPGRISGWAWLIILAGSQLGVGLLALRSTGWPASRSFKILALGLPVFLPSTMYSFVTGQISPLVGLVAILAVCWVSQETPNLVALSVVMGIATLKPHIVAVPLMLGLFELIRQKNQRAILALSILLTVLLAVGFLILPSWPSSLAGALLGGAFRGGPGLVASGYRGLTELGVPIWLVLPTLGYTIWRWWHEHLSANVLSLALASGLLLAPYTRSYDHAILAYPAVLALVDFQRGYRVGSLLILTAVTIPSLTPAWMLTPVVAFMGIMLLSTNESRILRTISTTDHSPKQTEGTSSNNPDNHKHLR